MNIPEKYPHFLAESTLGRLAKWLRLAGFDTLYDTHAPDPNRLARICRRENRILLTRTRLVHHHLGAQSSILISLNAPVDQVRQVMREMKLGPDSVRPLMRCACCNSPVKSVPPAHIYGRVPEHIWINHKVFKRCPQCDRIYWKGSHAKQWSLFMAQWFS